MQGLSALHDRTITGPRRARAIGTRPARLLVAIRRRGFPDKRPGYLLRGKPCHSLPGSFLCRAPLGRRLWCLGETLPSPRAIITPVGQFRLRQSGTRKAHGEILVDNAGSRDARISSGSPARGRCVFCSREFDASFLYCPFCGGRLRRSDGPEMKWYYSRYAVAIGLGTIGPFALPLVWFNPRYTVSTKVALTVLILALTVLILWGLWWCCARLLEMIGQLTSLY